MRQRDKERGNSNRREKTETMGNRDRRQKEIMRMTKRDRQTDKKADGKEIEENENGGEKERDRDRERGNAIKRVKTGTNGENKKSERLKLLTTEQMSRKGRQHKTDKRPSKDREK